MSCESSPVAVDQHPLMGGRIGRVRELDGIRGLAILMVLLTHVFCYSMMSNQWSGAGRLVLLVTSPGWLGVDLFFVLSGFLITGILLDSKSDSRYFRNFYARRALRILPLYLMVLIVLLVFYRNSWPFVLSCLFMSANLAPLFGISMPTGGGPIWSLAVEEHFYLIWPWLVRFARPPLVAGISAAICILEPAVRALARFAVYDVYLYSWFRFDGLAWGALLAVFVRWNGVNRRAALRAAGAVALAALFVLIVGMPFGIMHRGNRLGAALQFSIGEAVFASGILAVITLAGTPVTVIFRSFPLTWSGDLSYCLYLTHTMILEGMDWICGHFMDVNLAKKTLSFITIRAVAGLILCYAVAALSRRYFETPILRLKRHFSSQRAARGGAVA